MTTYTKATMLTLLINSHKAVEKGLYRLYQHQTADEQESSDTKHKNRRGFAIKTAEDGTRLGEHLAAIVETYEDSGYTIDQVPWGQIIPPGEDRRTAYSICAYHARQLAEIANERQEVVAAAA